MKTSNLCPIWSPLYIHRRLLYIFLQREIPKALLECSKSLQKHKVSVLDVGCGKIPYRSCFIENNLCESYEGADIENAPQVSVKINATTQEIQDPNESYDLIVSFQTLEHVQKLLGVYSHNCRTFLY